jgi:hypothetical protein
MTQQKEGHKTEEWRLKFLMNTAHPVSWIKRQADAL